ncbi:GNAT superfamily N-acetyltransferase [Nonomuraea thailandensis]|uniref:GNAT superfamily N-acetyltransferase n=1 Tax=Nonomuraea thailandensis TaxID=1188745 RepID=A0A9X2GPC5_9ACTN|nr:GNAT family N-acetyltransferase [Nonomuraea thailandensis]MCP2359266.1 GNAT superfamily N-acetyltransferase [Nonomuraea thailandensis]
MLETGVRAATQDDMPAVRGVARRFGLLGGWRPGSPDFLDAERAFGTLLLAPAPPGEEDGLALGFGGTLRRGELTHLADLFVLPAHQSSGLGRALLARLLAADGPRATFASSDPRALGLYVRHGLRPWCPLLYLTGPAAGLPAPRVRVTSAGEVAALDAAVAGGDRRRTLAWHAALPGVTAYAAGEGYAFARATAGGVLIGPAGGATPQDCANAVLGALAATTTPGTTTPGTATPGTATPGTAKTAAPALAATTTPDIGKIAVPGPHPLVPALIAAGWRIRDLDTLMADDAALALIHPDRYIPHPDLG